MINSRRFVSFLATRTPVGGLVRFARGTLHPLTHLSPFSLQKLYFSEISSNVDVSLEPNLQFDIICTTLNEEDSIHSMLEDIAAQVKRPTNVLIIDGGSSDKTVAIIDQFTDLRIKLIVKPGASIAAARNIGMANSDSPLLLFVDAGCRYPPKFAADMITTLSLNHLQYVGASYEPFDSSGNLMHDNPHIPVWNKRKLREFLPSARGLLVSRTLFEAVGGFPEFLTRAGEDTLWALWLRNRADRFGIQTSSPVQWCDNFSASEQKKRQEDYLLGDQESRYSDWIISKNPFAPHPAKDFQNTMQLRKKADLKRGIQNATLLITEHLLGINKAILGSRELEIIFDSECLVISISLKHKWWSPQKKGIFNFDLSKFEAHSLLCADKCFPAISINGSITKVLFDSERTKQQWLRLVSENKVNPEIVKKIYNVPSSTLDISSKQNR